MSCRPPVIVSARIIQEVLGALAERWRLARVKTGSEITCFPAGYPRTFKCDGSDAAISSGGFQETRAQTPVGLRLALG